MKNMLKLLSAVLAVLALSAVALAAQLTGTVTNGTNGKAPAGDDAVLLNLGEGMQEVARTKVDAQGHFSFNVPDDGRPHMVRVLHQGVNYFPTGGPIMPGSDKVEIKVWDVAKSVKGISVTAHVISVQEADSSSMKLTELYAVNNESSPPTTLMGEHPFEFYLPEGAPVDQSMAAAPNGMPVNSAAVPTSNGKYTIIFPVRPGETRFQVSYHLPYSGQATFQPKSLYSLQHLVVMTPKSMQFSGPENFQTMPDKDSDVHVLTGVEPDQQVAFKIAGTGVITRTEEQGGADGQGGGGPAEGGTAADNRPGGGIGAPIDAPDPLYNYHWPILIGLGMVLTFGAFYTLHRPQIAPAFPAAHGVAARKNGGRAEPGSLLLEAMKEELFQLEIDKAEGRISNSEYDKAKTALDQTIKRALARRKS